MTHMTSGFPTSLQGKLGVANADCRHVVWGLSPTLDLFKVQTESQAKPVQTYIFSSAQDLHALFLNWNISLKSLRWERLVDFCEAESCLHLLVA